MQIQDHLEGVENSATKVLEELRFGDGSVRIRLVSRENMLMIISQEMEQLREEVEHCKR